MPIPSGKARAAVPQGISGPAVADFLLVTTILTLGWWAIFHLPYAYPPSLPTRSLSYRLEFNNQISILATAGVVALLTLRQLFWHRKGVEPIAAVLADGRPSGIARHPQMPKSILYLTLGLTVLSICLIYYCIPDLYLYFEAASGLPRMELAMYYDVAPYSDVWWPYGPALYYIPKWFMAAGLWFGAEIEDSYIASHMVLCSLGVWALYYLVDQLRIKVAYRGILFVILAIATHTWSLGAHVTLLRHAVPYIVLLWLHRAAGALHATASPPALRRVCIVSAAGSLVMLSISPEMALVQIAGLSAYCGWQAWFAGRVWLWPLFSALGTLPVWLLLFPGCLSMAGSFAQGADCVPVVPAAHVLFYLAAMFWILPKVLGTGLSRRGEEGAPLLLGWGVMGLATIPPALGRCDAAHILWNGMGVIVLAGAVAAKCRPRLFPIYSMLLLVIFGVIAQFANGVAEGASLKWVRKTLAGERLKKVKIPLSAEPGGLAPYSPIAAPFGVDRATRSYLFRTHRYAPQYHLDLSCVVSMKDVEEIMAGLRSASYLLVPEFVLSYRGGTESDLVQHRAGRQKIDDEAQSLGMGTSFLYPFPVRSKRPGFDAEVELAFLIANSYSPLFKGQGWAVMVRSTPQTK